MLVAVNYPQEGIIEKKSKLKSNLYQTKKVYQSKKIVLHSTATERSPKSNFTPHALYGLPLIDSILLPV